MKRIAVFGGSFSPIHKGHLKVASGILERDLADEVWLMPCRQNPLKGGVALQGDEIRMTQIEKAIAYAEEERPSLKGKIKIWDEELKTDGPSYTSESLRKLTASFPEYRFRLAVGGDSYETFTQWKEWEWLEENFSPILYPRPGHKIDNIREKWTYLENMELTDISSTRLREMLKNGEPVVKWMPWQKS